LFGFVLHIPAGHATQFRIDLLGQTAQGCFVTAAPGFLQIVISAERASTDSPSPGGLQKKYTKPWPHAPPLPPVHAEGEQAVGTISFRNGENFMHPKEMIMKRNAIGKALTLAAVTVLALALAPIARAEDNPCSKAILKGTFADKDTGSIIGVGRYNPSDPSLKVLATPEVDWRSVVVGVLCSPLDITR